MRTLWELSGPCDDPLPQRLIPDGAMSLWINFGAPLTCGSVGCHVPRGATLFLGEVRRPFEVASTGALDVVGVSFWAGHARSFVDARLPELVDRLVADPPLVARLARALRDSVHGAPRAERVRLLQEALARAICPARAPSARIRRALSLLEHQERALPIATLADSVGVSTRQLARGFAEEVGVSPKQMASILRFRRALDAVRTGRPDFAAIAQRCGYADQAHLVRDFTRYAGLPPARFVVTEVPRTRAEWLARARCAAS